MIYTTILICTVGTAYLSWAAFSIVDFSLAIIHSKVDCGYETTRLERFKKELHWYTYYFIGSLFMILAMCIVIGSAFEIYKLYKP